MNFAHGRYFSGNIEILPFKNQLNNFGYFRHPLKNKAKHDCNYYRKDNRYHRYSTSSLDKGEEYSNKYKTEICKNFELTGKCQWREMVR